PRSAFRVNFYVSSCLKILALVLRSAVAQERTASRPHRERNLNEDSRVSGEGDTGALWRDDAARRSGFHQGRSARSRAAPEVEHLRRESANPRRRARKSRRRQARPFLDRKSTRLNSSHGSISYAV